MTTGLYREEADVIWPARIFFGVEEALWVSIDDNIKVFFLVGTRIESVCGIF